MINAVDKTAYANLVKDIFESSNIDPLDLYCDDWDSDGHCYDIFFDNRVEEIACGASKAVLFLKDFKDYVVKVPFYGYGYRDEDEEEICRFSGAGCHININSKDWDASDDDYCAVEALIYDYAVECGVDHFLAGTTYLCHANGVEVYISERIEPDTCLSSRFSEESDESWGDAVALSSDDASARYFTRDYLSILINQYGLDETIKFCHFIADVGCSDFHSGNWGVGNDGRIKILDYSGYNS